MGQGRGAAQVPRATVQASVLAGRKGVRILLVLSAH